MKKILAILLAVVMLLSLAACGQETVQEQGAAPEKTEQDVAQSESASDELYTEEMTLEDGSTYIAYHKGGPEGPVVRGEYTGADGSYSDEYYSEDGKPVSMYYKGPDGVAVESTFYPSGSSAKDIITYPDGSSEEIHFADNGSVDPETGYILSGTITYHAQISADGQVTVLVSGVEVEEDGSWWEIHEMENGTSRTHFGEGWKIIEDIMENTVEGYTIVTTYHENGAPKVSKYIGEDGREINYECNEEGYYTHYYDRDQYGVREYFAGENNELVKYIENDKVYEGDAISKDVVNVFKQMQDMAAEVAYNLINGI